MGVFLPLPLALTKPAFTRFLNRSEMLLGADGPDEVEGGRRFANTGVEDEEGALA